MKEDRVFIGEIGTTKYYLTKEYLGEVMKEQINTIKPEKVKFYMTPFEEIEAHAKKRREMVTEVLESIEDAVDPIILEMQLYKTATYILLVGYLIMILLKSL